MRKNNFSNGAGAITDRTLEKQAFSIIPEGVAEVIFAHRLKSGGGGNETDLPELLEIKDLRRHPGFLSDTLSYTLKIPVGCR